MKSKYKPYSSYKDSGVEWLGLLPESWEARRLGFYFSERREKVSDKDYPALSVTKKGIVPQLDSAAKTDDGDNRKKVCVGDFVINSRSDRKGSSGLSELTGSVSLINTIITPKSIDGKYTHNLLRSYPFQEEFYRYGKGIVADLWSTNYTSMKNILIPFPPLSEQQTIAHYLDSATAKIDTLIEKQTKLIALLKEKRQAVISTAVTRGLDSSVPMKDSGVEWLGEIPEHWEVKKLKNSARIQGGKDQKAVLDDNGKYPVYGSGGIFGYANKYLHNGESVLLGRKGTVDKPLYVHDKFWTVDTMYYTVIEKTTVAKWLYYSATTINFDYYQYGSAVPSMTQEDLHNIHFATPDKNEQQVIVDYLDTKTTQIDSLVSKATKAIELLKEKRTALISSAVTGKIDVREIV